MSNWCPPFQSLISIERIDQRVTEPPVNSTTTTTEPPSPDETPFFETGIGIVLIVFLVLLGLGAIGGAGFWFWKRKQNGGRRSSHA